MGKVAIFDNTFLFNKILKNYARHGQVNWSFFFKKTEIYTCVPTLLLGGGEVEEVAYNQCD